MTGFTAQIGEKIYTDSDEFYRDMGAWIAGEQAKCAASNAAQRKRKEQMKRLQTIFTVAFASIIVLLAIIAVSFAGDLPDPTITPGVINPAVTQDNIQSTICVPNWTTTIRPPASYTNKLKLRQMAAQDLPGKPNDYEEDHLISLEIGGNPTDPKNLWPQHWSEPWGAHDKDRYENVLHRLVCSERITLEAAQAEIRSDWIAGYKTRIGSPN